MKVQAYSWAIGSSNSTTLSLGDADGWFRKDLRVAQNETVIAAGVPQLGGRGLRRTVPTTLTPPAPGKTDEGRTEERERERNQHAHGKA